MYTEQFFKINHKIFTMGQIQCLPPPLGSQVVGEDLFRGWMLFQGRQISLCASGFPILKYEWSAQPTDFSSCKNMKGMYLMYIYGNEVDALCCGFLELRKALGNRHYRRQTHSHLWYLFWIFSVTFRGIYFHFRSFFSWNWSLNLQNFQIGSLFFFLLFVRC